MHFPAGIIPARAFSQIRMNLPAGNHPCEKNHKNRDEFPGRKSSLPDFSCNSGSISPTEIIPARHFLQIRMNLPTGNHPYKTFPAYQDAFPRRKSSLQELFCISGSIFPAGIIPARTFLQFRMHFPAGNHPCYEVTIVKKRLKEISFSRQATFVFL